MAKTWIECFQEAKIIAGAGRQPCKSWVTGLWPDFEVWTVLLQNKTFADFSGPISFGLALNPEDFRSCRVHLAYS